MIKRLHKNQYLTCTKTIQELTRYLFVKGRSYTVESIDEIYIISEDHSSVSFESLEEVNEYFKVV